MKDSEFKVRMFGFGELASLYKPNVAKKSASNFLNITISKDNELFVALEKVKYTKGMKSLTPAMVKIIVDYLGEPY